MGAVIEKTPSDDEVRHVADDQAQQAHVDISYASSAIELPSPASPLSSSVRISR